MKSTPKCTIRSSNLPSLIDVDGICLFAENEGSLQSVCDNVIAVIEEYGLNANEEKSRIIDINGVIGIKS